MRKRCSSLFSLNVTQMPEHYTHQTRAVDCSFPADLLMCSELLLNLSILRKKYILADSVWKQQGNVRYSFHHPTDKESILKTSTWWWNTECVLISKSQCRKSPVGYVCHYKKNFKNYLKFWCSTILPLYETCNTWAHSRLCVIWPAILDFKSLIRLPLFGGTRSIKT